MHRRFSRLFRLALLVSLPVGGCAQGELLGTDIAASPNAAAQEDAPAAEPEQRTSDSTVSAPRGKGKREGAPRPMAPEPAKKVASVNKDKFAAPPPATAGHEPTYDDDAEASPRDITSSIDGDGTFESAGVNPFVTTAHDRFSTFAIDVDTGSYTYALGRSRSGYAPAAASVRVEEWVNAFHYAYADPANDAPFAVHMQGAPSPFVGDVDSSTSPRKVLRIGLQGRRISNEARNPAHVTLLVDVSGSMSATNKLPLAKTAMRELVSNLRADDYVAIVTYAGRTEEHLPTTSCDDKRSILRAIDSLQTGGGTNMGSGMELAFRNAGMHLATGVTSRVVVISDGDANIGRTRHETILETVRGYVSEGVTLSTVGMGNGNYNDHLMEQLADAGNGNYSYIDSAATAKRVFGTDLVANLQVIAQDVKIQVEFNPTYVRDYRLLGYENRDVADRDFRNDKKDAGELGAGHSVTALYEITLHATDDMPERATLATVRLRHKTPRHPRATETQSVFTAGDLLPRLDEADDDTRQALAVAMVAEYARASPYADRAVGEAGLALLPAARGSQADERRAFAAMAAQILAPGRDR